MSADGAWFNGVLEPYQREGVEFLLDRPNAILADDVGLGKTPQALAYIGRLEEREELRRWENSLCRILWVTEKNLVEQTTARVEQFLPQFLVATGDDLDAMNKTKKGRASWQQRFAVGPDILVLSHDLAKNRESMLARTRPKLLVIDETKAVQGGEKLTQAMLEYTKRSSRVVALTATPCENHPMELYWLLRVAGVKDLWPRGVFERDFVQMREVSLGRGRVGRKPHDWKYGKAEEVSELLANHMLLREASGVGIPLPERVGESIAYVPLTAEELSQYEKASERTDQGVVGAMEAAAREAGGRSSLVDDLLRRVLDMNGEQSIVYSGSLYMLDLIEAGLAGVGISSVRIEGRVSDADREQAVRRHRSGEVQVLLGSSVLERGLDLQHCRRMVSVDSSWNPSREHQREGRMRRYGSPHATYEHLTLLPDVPLAKAKVGKLSRKRAMADAVLPRLAVQ